MLRKNSSAKLCFSDRLKIFECSKTIQTACHIKFLYFRKLFSIGFHLNIKQNTRELYFAFEKLVEINNFNFKYTVYDSKLA